MRAVIICEMFGWTYEEYLDQPIDFLELIRGKIRADAQAAKKAAQKRR